MKKIAIILPSIGMIPYMISGLYGKDICFINFTLGQKLIDLQLELFAPDTIITSKRLVEKRTISFGEGYRVFYVEKSLLKILSILIVGYLRVKTGIYKKQILLQSIHLFTSGSTGTPKLINLPIVKIAQNVQGFLKHSGLKEGKKFLCILPGFHSFGLSTNILLPLLQYCSIVDTDLSYEYYPNIVDIPGLAAIIHQKRIAYMATTPYFLKMLLVFATPEQLASIEAVFVGGDFTSKDILQLFHQKIPHGKYVKGYGMTECFPVISSCVVSAIDHTTDGKILPHIQYVLLTNDNEFTTVGEGKLLIHNDYVIEGYVAGGNIEFIDYNNQKYYDTNDWVQVKHDRTLTLLARDNRILKKGGELINIQFLELHINSYMNSVDFCCLNYNSQIYIVSKEQVSIDSLNSYIISSGLSPLYKVHKNIITTTIPKNGIGKIQYNDIYLYVHKYENAGNSSNIY